ncbi:prolipoprotein diacylglyceryl transferase [Candidatus Woesearchaeota archaeon]|nr:prolipoprotein diacylglyceryl transferase [Candidatus Woesearchaeota archaeon]
MNPVLLKLGFLEIRYYSLVYIIGFLLAYFVLIKAVKSKKVKNLTKAAAEDFMVYLILGSIIGGRLFHFIFFNPSVIWTDPLEILFIWHGGISFHGGLIGAVVGYYFFRKKYDVKFYDLADLLMIPFAFTLFLGRIANFINGELWGTVTNVNWCVQFQGVEGCRHPSQLYEAAKNLVIFGVLWFMKDMKKLKKGMIFWSFVLMYGLLRFIVNFWRDVDREMGQILSLIMVVIAVYFLFKLKNSKN